MKYFSKLIFPITIGVNMFFSCLLAYGTDSAITASSVAFISTTRQSSSIVSSNGRLLFKININSSIGQIDKAILHIPLQIRSKGILYLRECSDKWNAKRVTWASRPSMRGPVLGAVKVLAKDSEALFDVSSLVTNSSTYVFSLYGSKGSKVKLQQIRKAKSYPRLSVIQTVPTAIATPTNIVPTFAATLTPLATAVASATNTITPTVTPTSSPVVSGVLISRGPYLQRGSPTSIIVRWRSDIAGDSSVYYGLTPTSLSFTSADSTSTTEHRVVLSGLTPNTTYYYRVGTSVGSYQSPDETQFFVTSPNAGTIKDTRVWVIGDAGTATDSQLAVRDAYINFTGSKHTDIWMMLGDNAYNSGTDQEYQNGVFDVYQFILKNSVLWPTIGNHDASDAQSENLTATYYDIFSLPRLAEAGGTPSSTEAYYSFDYGDIHFICLNSVGTNHRSNAGPMKSWLQSDLTMASTKKWIVAFWHYPPYSKGSHDSDTETGLREMRENILPVLEDGGVDLVLTGHSHAYERTYLIDGYYGLSTDFNNSYKRSNSGGSVSSGGIYTKNLFARNSGTVYVTAGSSGKLEGGSLAHPAMFTSQVSLGSLVLDFSGNNLDVKFLRSTGIISDSFTVQKVP